MPLTPFRHGFTAIGLLYAMGCLAAPIATVQYETANTITVPGPARWDYMNFDTPSNRLYIAQGQQVTVIDMSTKTPLGVVSPTDGVHGIAIDARNNTGFASAGGANAVVAFDLKTLKIKDSIPVGRMPDCIIYDPATNRVFAFDGGSNEASVIDAATRKLIGTIPLDGRPEYAAADGKGHVFVNIESKSELSRINARKMTVSHTWTLSPGEGPSGLAIDARHERLFSVCHNGMMVVMNGNAGKVVATAPIGTGPDAAGFDPGTGLAFSSNGQGTLTVVKEVNPNSFIDQQTVQTEPGARTMALDLKTHTVYVCTATPDPKPLPSGTPFWMKRYLPNTFHLVAIVPDTHKSMRRHRDKM